MGRYRPCGPLGCAGYRIRRWHLLRDAGAVKLASISRQSFAADIRHPPFDAVGRPVWVCHAWFCPHCHSRFVRRVYDLPAGHAHCRPGTHVWTGMTGVPLVLLMRPSNRPKRWPRTSSTPANLPSAGSTSRTPRPGTPAGGRS